MPDTDVALIVTLDGAIVLAALLRPDELARRVAAVDAAVERQALARADVADIVAGALHERRFATPAARAHIASLLAWLATRDPGVADRARRGGVHIAWHVASPEAEGKSWRLALHVADSSEPGEGLTDESGVGPFARPELRIH